MYVMHVGITAMFDTPSRSTEALKHNVTGGNVGLPDLRYLNTSESHTVYN